MASHAFFNYCLLLDKNVLQIEEPYVSPIGTSCFRFFNHGP
jgi:hypothetical protein